MTTPTIRDIEALRSKLRAAVAHRETAQRDARAEGTTHLERLRLDRRLRQARLREARARSLLEAATEDAVRIARKHGISVTYTSPDTGTLAVATQREDGSRDNVVIPVERLLSEISEGAPAQRRKEPA